MTLLLDEYNYGNVHTHGNGGPWEYIGQLANFPVRMWQCYMCHSISYDYGE